MIISELDAFFKDVSSHNDGRLIYLVFPTHLYTIQEIFDSAVNSHRKIVIMGKKLQNVINFGVENKYLNIADGLLGDLSNIDDPNSILLVSDERANPFASISKILNGYDKFITLKPNDSVIFAEPRYDSTEKQLVKINYGDKLPLDIIAVEAAGHTPGHVCYRKDNLLIIGDLIHGQAIQFKYPEICATYDHDENGSIESRKNILKYAQDNKLFLGGMHLQYSNSSMYQGFYKK